LVLTLNITLNRVDYARTGTWEEHSSISITASNDGLIWLAEPGGPGGMKKLKARVALCFKAFYTSSDLCEGRGLGFSGLGWWIILHVLVLILSYPTSQEWKCPYFFFLLLFILSSSAPSRGFAIEKEAQRGWGRVSNLKCPRLNYMTPAWVWQLLLFLACLSIMLAIFTCWAFDLRTDPILYNLNFDQQVKTLAPALQGGRVWLAGKGKYTSCPTHGYVTQQEIQGWVWCLKDHNLWGWNFLVLSTEHRHICLNSWSTLESL
jgi:hypothetical protein